MSAIDDLYKKLGVHSGSWTVPGTNIPLPDLSFTEKVADAFGQSRNSQGGSQLRQGTILNVGNVPYQSGGIVGSATTKTVAPPSGGAPTPTGSVPTTDTGNDVSGAQDAYRARINSILQQVGLMRDIAARSLDRARGVRDEIVGNIGSTYGALRDTAAQKLQSTLDTLNTEGINVENQYGRAEGQSRKAMEGALTKNRMLARSMNRLNSSFYDDRQAGVTENTAKAISDIGVERTGKLTGIETRRSENKNWFDQETVKIGEEEASLKSQADRDYQQQVDNANFNEQAFGIDSVEALQGAADEYQSRISKIEDYANNKALRLAEIAATSGTRGAGINAYEAISPTLKATLENARGLNLAKETAANLPVFNSNNTPTGLTDPLAFYKQDQNSESAYNKILARLDPRRAAALGIA